MKYFNKYNRIIIESDNKKNEIAIFKDILWPHLKEYLGFYILIKRKLWICALLCLNQHLIKSSFVIKMNDRIYIQLLMLNIEIRWW